MTAGAYPGFCSIKRLGIFAIPPGWDASPSQVTSLGGEKHCESKVSCPRTQQNDPARARTRTSRSGVKRTNH